MPGLIVAEGKWRGMNLGERGIMGERLGEERGRNWGRRVKGNWSGDVIYERGINTKVEKTPQLGGERIRKERQTDPCGVCR